MKIIIPCAGKGQRFVDAGYAESKPFITINGFNGPRMIIDYVLDMTLPNDEVHFIFAKPDFDSVYAKNLVARSKNYFSYSIDPHSKGPCFSIVKAIEAGLPVNDDEEVLIYYCDGTTDINRPYLAQKCGSLNLDGCLVTHSGFHPHTLASTKMAFIREEGGRVLEVKEKESFTSEPEREQASSGMYYFRKGRYVKHYFTKLIETTPGHSNGEYYVTLAYNLMISDGLNIGLHETANAAILGTPECVKNFEAWATILEGSQVKTETDAIDCYSYWRDFKENQP